MMPTRLDYEEGQPIPDGYHLDSEPRMGLVIGGSVTLGVTWLLGGLLPGALLLTGCSVGTNTCGSGGALLVPALGPFIAMPFVYENGGEGDRIQLAYLAFDGVAQSAGAVMLILGLALQRDYLRRDNNPPGTFSWMPMPMAVGETGRGFGVVGTF